MTFGGFEVGKTYNRRRDIHGKFRGPQQDFGDLMKLFEW
jgi:hypothetical protein